MTHWNDGYLRGCKCELELELACGSTFGNFGGLSVGTPSTAARGLDSVSVALGHSSTKTTEADCARMKSKDAFRDLERVWVTPSVQKPAD